MKWVMDGFYHFYKNENGYVLDVKMSGLGWVWEIIKDGVIVDSAYYHPDAPTSELDAKVKAEKFFKRLLITPTQTNKT